MLNFDLVSLKRRLDDSKAMSRRLKVAAIICARNEEFHINRCLSNIIDEGVDAVLIDHDSEDRTVDIARRHLGRGLLSIERLKWEGYFGMQDQLRRKSEIIAQLDHDWVVHVDADEWLCAPPPATSLRDAIEQVDQAGFNCINFDEVVFLPGDDDDFTHTDYTRAMTTYYYFAPKQPRLMRAWRRDAGLNNIEYAGHLLAGEGIKLCPINFILRHYIALSYQHAIRKYVGRKFDERELNMGWHFNRSGLMPDDLRLRSSPYLRQLDDGDDQQFDLSAPSTAHYWEWRSRHLSETVRSGHSLQATV